MLGVSPEAAPIDRVRIKLARDSVLARAVSGVDPSDSDLATDFWDSPTKSRSRGYRLLGSHCEVTFGR